MRNCKYRKEKDTLEGLGINGMIIIIIIIIINCNWVVNRWQWLFYMYTKHEIGY